MANGRDEEDERFDVVLIRVWDWEHKISLIKLVREVTGLEIREARNFIEQLPQTVKRELPLGDAEDMRQRFDGLGVFVETRPSSRP